MHFPSSTPYSGNCKEFPSFVQIGLPEFDNKKLSPCEGIALCKQIRTLQRPCRFRIETVLVILQLRSLTEPTDWSKPFAHCGRHQNVQNILLRMLASSPSARVPGSIFCLIVAGNVRLIVS